LFNSFSPNYFKKVDCATLPHMLLLGDWVSNLDVHIPDLLDKYGVDVLVYSGEVDFSKKRKKEKKEMNY